ncbi:RUN and SH3 domain-containing protein 1 [Fasciola gigantica]|uniref:RUN and SH3 domain-containing protein 1 n=1 Tax=Fasciola gigantica TaxID=46835 RepID=A0A504YTV0_FASGI|nr:RUN and SH3 domain-containing protein 1 [Fasciola gigantica]
MYHPLSAVEGNPYLAIGISPKGTFPVRGANAVVDPANQEDNLKVNSKFRLDEISTVPMHPDSTSLQTPVVSSVWLEQGEYFFDDEFAVSFDTNLVDPCDGNPCMTQSSGVDPPGIHGPLPLDQSRSDSCMFTPGDSGESGLASAQTEQTQSSGENNALRLNSKGAKTESSPQAHLSTNPQTVNGYVPGPGAPVSSDSYSKSDNSHMCTQNGVINIHPIVQNGNSVSGSQASGQSGSTSWMQMIMERSCNPDLKALLSRTAATVDYKLAYAETFPTDSSMTSSVQQLLQEKCPLLCTADTCGLSRSLSQGNLLTVAGLAGLRHALNQTAQYLPKGAAPQVRSVGVNAELTSGGNSGAATGASSCADVNTSNTTTWAQKHGSRESLKRKTKRNNDVLVIPAPASVPSVTKTKPETSNPWREMKKASGTLITWNQLKRTIKGNQKGLERTATFRESRREQHMNVADKDDNNSSDVAHSNSPAESGAAVRSRSHPVSCGHYMHRFSGTLLEIFMRAKAEEMTFLNPTDEDIGVVRGHTASFDQGCDPYVNKPANDKLDRGKYLAFPSPGRCTAGSRTDLIGSRSESEKHPLLRGNRILPQKWHPNSPTSPSTDQNSDQKFVRNFGAQFPPPSTENNTVPCTGTTLSPPQSPNCTSPIWSNGLPVRRTNATLRATRYPFSRHSHPRNPSLPGRPQSFAHNKPVYNRCLQEPAIERQSSSGAPPAIAACLTASAGPDSPYMAALRADYVADGYSAGWLGNPRASIAYPGLGLLSIPRPSRLTSASFLSHTLPDLSFLTQAAEEEERKGTPTMPKRLACRCLSRDKAEHCCARCGCRSLSVGRTQKCKHKRRTSCKPTRPSENETPAGSSEFDDDHGIKVRIRLQRPRTSDPPPVIPDLVMGHKGNMQPSTEDNNHEDSTGHHNSVMQSMCHVDRSTSEPDLSAAVLNSAGQNPDSMSTPDGSYTRPNALMTSSTQECYGWDSYKDTDDCLFGLARRPKKSVSFSGKIRSLRLHGLTDKDVHDHSPASPEPRLIPRNWGLYGQETPLAEFNPRNSPGRDTIHGTEPAQQSDLDIRYHAMVNDVIKAVQEMVAHLTNSGGSKTPGKQRNGRQAHEPLPFSVVAALGSTSHQPLLSVIGPLTVLLSDGLLPPAKPFFTPRPRTRLWQMVEESCRPSPHLTGVSYCILNDAVSQVKALTNVTLERVKFKAFLCACLNVKALPLWLNAVVANDSLMRRFYCEDAFVRQCRSSQRGLHADLMTHLEQLLAFPFELDLAVEARKPLIDPNSVPKPSSASGESNGPVRQQVGTNNKNNNTSNNGASDQAASAATGEGTTTTGQLAKVTSRPSIPPSIVTKRKQLILTQGPAPNRSRFSPSPVSAANTQNQAIHHYPQHHLPGQRTTAAPTRLGAPSRFSRPGNQRPGEESGASSASSEPRGPTDAKSSQPRVSTAGSNPPNGPNPPTRGRFKSALSTFRRTTPMVTTASPSKNASNASGYCTNSVPMVNSQSGKSNETNTPPPLNNSIQNVPKIASKLKQPSTIVGRR